MVQSVRKLLLERWISIWRIPSELHSDRGTHFSGQIVTGICKMWMIMQHFHCACHPRTSGLIEKTNGTIKTQLAKITDVYSFPWLKALPLVLNLGSTPLTNITCLPLKLLQGDQWDNRSYDPISLKVLFEPSKTLWWVWNVKVKVTPSCPTLCDAMNYTVHGILQVRLLVWGAFLFSRRSSQLRDQTQVSRIAGGFFTRGATRAAQQVWGLILNVISSLLPSYWASPFPLDVGYFLFGEIQHSPFDGCSAASYNFGVLAAEHECMSFYSAILPDETADRDCSHEIKRCLLLGRKAMTKIDSIFKSRDITMPMKVCLVKDIVFPVVMYGCESWTIKKSERQRIDDFELWCWRRLLRVPWTARRQSQLILKEISPGYLLEGLMSKLKVQYFGHLMQRTDSLEKILMLGKI